MLAKRQVTFLNSLKTKKFRELHKLFIAEGTTLVVDLLKSSFTIRDLFAERSWIDEHARDLGPYKGDITVITEGEMGRLTLLATPSPVLATVVIPEQDQPSIHPGSGPTLLLDDIRDPGNMGTIIRIADWFGIKTVFCSETTVDRYNPKVVQATMGSITRVSVFYLDTKNFLDRLERNIPVYGAFLHGRNIYHSELNPDGIIVIGNETRGISPEIEKLVTDRISIPSFPKERRGSEKAESLNASVAAAIICAEFRRREIG